MGLQRWKRNQKKVNSTSSTIGERDKRDKKAILLKALNPTSQINQGLP
jgi:hypothetical protein